MSDDSVWVLLDPFHDRRRGILFELNPANVQADAAWTEGNGSDFSYDQVWDSEAHVTEKGWMALLPFRFAACGSGRGRRVGRCVDAQPASHSESDNWPPHLNQHYGMLSQEATLHGIRA